MLGYANSLVNPIGGSSASTMGAKTNAVDLVFSVGYQTSSPGYVTLDQDGDIPTANIAGGIVTFSFPQDNIYVGVGDMISTPSIALVITKKITTSKWEVRVPADGSVPADGLVEVIKIDKAFGGLKAAIDGTNPGVKQVYGVDMDLVSNGTNVKILCYSMQDSSTGVVVSPGWTTGPGNSVSIYTPIDIAKESNGKQRALTNNTNDGYHFSSSNYGIVLQANYSRVEGLYVQAGGLGAGQDGITIDASTTTHHCHIAGCVSHNSNIAFNSTSLGVGNIIAFCTAYNCNTALNTSLGTLTYNFTGSAEYNGIRGVANSVVYNSAIVESSVRDYAVGLSLYNCISSDTTAIGTNCHIVTNIIFDDAPNSVNLLEPRSFEPAVKGGYNISAEKSKFIYQKDILGNIVDETSGIGSHHFTRIMPVSTMSSRPELSAGGLATVVNGTMTFTVPQTNDNITRGCVVTLISSAPSKYYLYKKISSTVWRVVIDGVEVAGQAGSGVVSRSVATIDSIKAVHGGLDDALNGISGVIGRTDLVDDDIAYEVSCISDGTGASASLEAGLRCDINRNVRIYTPNDTATNCNVTHRHYGKWDNDKFVLTVEDGDGIDLNAGFIEIEGLQIKAEYNGINVSGAESINIHSNIIKECGKNGVLLNSSSIYDDNGVYNNLIYSCEEGGVTMLHNRGVRASGTAGTSGTNDWRLRLIEPELQYDNKTILVGGSPGNEPGIIWGENSLEILAYGYTMQQVINSENVSGKPWGEIEVLNSSAQAQGQYLLFGDLDNKIEGELGAHNAYFSIFNNTLAYNKYGVYTETKNQYDYTNIVTIKNNISQNNTSKDYWCNVRKPSTVTSGSNYCGDESIKNIIGDHNSILKKVDFVDYKNEDYHIILSDAIGMTSAQVLSADPHYQIYDDIDNELRDPGRWDLGCDTYKNPNYNAISMSVGDEEDNLDSSTTRNIKISNSILTFVGGSPGILIGVGDEVRYNTTMKCYLADKGTDNIWRVATNLGASVNDQAEISSSGVYRVSKTLKDAFTSDLSTAIGSDNLVALNASLKVFCYYDNGIVDDGDIEVSSWTTSLNSSIKVSAPYNLKTQCGKSQRHDGKWGFGYKIEATNFGNAVTVLNKYVQFDGVSVEGKSSSHKAFHFSEPEGNSVTRCIIKNALSGIHVATGTGKAESRFNTIYNCGNATSGDIKNISCTSYDCDIGFNGVCVNCLSTNSQTLCFSDSSTSTENCASSDETATGTNSRINVDITYVNTILRDFRLLRDDIDAIGLGKVPVGFSDHTVLDINSNPVDDDWCIGSHYLFPETVDLYFSSCSNDEELKQGILTEISILAGVMQFSNPQAHDKLAVGDVVHYGVSSKAYLASKISDTAWNVVTNRGESPVNTLSKTLNSIRHTFIHLQHVFTDSGLGHLIGSTANPFNNLKSAKYRINISMLRGIVHSNIVITGYVTDSNNIIKIYTPYDIKTECNIRHRHSGIFDTPTHNLDSGSVTGENALTIENDNVIAEGLQVTGNSQTNDGIVLKDCNNVTVVGCIVFDAITGIKSNILFAPDENYKNKIINNIAANCSEDGITCAGFDITYNNTTANTGHNGIVSIMTDKLKNNSASKVGSGYKAYTCKYQPEFCLADDGSLFRNAGSIPYSSTYFENLSSNNLRLAYDDLRGAGASLLNDDNYKLSLDAAMLQRDRLWDMGALEYTGYLTVARSVGGNTGDLSSRTVGGLTGQVSTIDGKSVMEFSTPQIGAYLGRGDRVHGTGLTQCYLISKIDSSNWIVASNYGAAISNDTYVIDSIERAHGDLKDALYYVSQSFDSSPHNTRIYVTCYKETVDTSHATLSTNGGDVDGFVKIYTPIDTALDCNTQQRHSANITTGYLLRPQGSAENLPEKSLYIPISHYTEVVGIGFDGTNANPDSNGIFSERSHGVHIDSNILKNFNSDAIRIEDAPTEGVISSIVNNVIYDIATNGISIIVSDYASFYGNSSIYKILNNTISNCKKRGIYRKENALHEDTMRIDIINNIVNDSRYSDIVLESYAFGGYSNLVSNITSDNSSWLYAGYDNYKNTFVEFVLAGTDYRLERDQNDFATDSAKDLSNNGSISFSKDALLVNRPEGQWDIGAYEIPPDIYGIGSCNINNLTLTNDRTKIGESYDTFNVYLREDPWTHISSSIQGTTVAEVNAIINAAPKTDNLIVFVQADKTFPGTLSFGNRGTNRTVKVITDPLEYGLLPAELTYTGPIIDNTSIQNEVLFQNIKVYSSSSAAQNYLLDNASLLTRLRFVNAIVQVNNDAVIDNIPALTIITVNSIIIYRNTTDQSGLYFTKTSTRCDVFNSIVITYKDSDVVFHTSSAVSTDEVRYNMLYNYGSGNISVSVATGYSSNNLFVNPDFENAELTSREFNIATTMADAFMIKKISLAIDAGNNYYITDDPVTPRVDESFNYDIIGNARIFNYTSVDIGPYEIKVWVFNFGANNVTQLFQDKLIADHTNERFTLLSNDEVYVDMWNQFDDLPTGYRDEFSRGSKIIIDVDFRNERNIIKIDKSDYKVVTYEAYYDEETSTIVSRKGEEFLGNIWKNALKDGKYTFNFNEINHELIIYINDTYDKGLSGDRSPVKTVRFSGHSSVSI